MTTTEPSLADLAAASGVEARTIRSWVAQGLLPAPLTRGPAARYPAETLDRVLAIRAMRDLHGLSLADIRKELLVATPDRIRAHADAARAAAPGMTPDTTPGTPPLWPAPATGGPPAATRVFRHMSSARDYIDGIRARSMAGTPVREPVPPDAPPAQGFHALERRLASGRHAPARKARTEQWLRIPITPDVELSVRAPLDPAESARLERCADLIRDILLGRDP
ncbi:helix-turn-helix domain-containing protein [Acidisphaera rubrifaciens]|uniref:Transcriptional regulator MarR n=1 Tax=Acidisphaera rubrifaciens HS-AP3 TaxID=1231350 RepID=A0A0D6P5K7_9PROT|nr:helix-turn-helix domain-containing protein [Acidisphaera rubrifaciens]GAN76149.1 transcriptional regulator MarR [Acidisphaera rubrifaciens HS-AP3]